MAYTEAGAKEVRILMLHGYAQSGTLFRAKTRALEKTLTKALARHNWIPKLFYPTAPNHLSPGDIPGWDNRDDFSTEKPDSWAWWRKDEASGEYRLFDEGMSSLARFIKDEVKVEGHGAREAAIHGVVGFSQGGCLAALVAAALDPSRVSPSVIPYNIFQWLPLLRAANNHRPLGFAVVYSGFWASPEELQWLYPVRTRSMHFIGGLDTVVEEGRSRALMERCEGASVVMHPGGHYVPVGREWVGVLGGFVRDCTEVRGMNRDLGEDEEMDGR